MTVISPLKIVQRDIVTEIADTEDQIQQNGIDLTLAKISELNLMDKNILTKALRSHCSRKEINLDDEVYLASGIYDIEFAERVNIPNGMMAQIFTRSTVNRGGNFITAGLYDAGFNNYVGAILHINIPLTIQKGVKLAQIVFYEAEEGSMYEGIYNTAMVAGGARPEDSKTF